MKSNKIFAIVAGVLGLVGVIVEVAADLDNVYDMTTTLLFVLIVIFAFLGAFVGRQQSTIVTASEEARKSIK